MEGRRSKKDERERKDTIQSKMERKRRKEKGKPRHRKNTCLVPRKVKRNREDKPCRSHCS